MLGEAEHLEIKLIWRTRKERATAKESFLSMGHDEEEASSSRYADRRVGSKDWSKALQARVERPDQ